MASGPSSLPDFARWLFATGPTAALLPTNCWRYPSPIGSPHTLRLASAHNAKRSPVEHCPLAVDPILILTAPSLAPADTAAGAPVDSAAASGRAPPALW